MRIVMVIYPEVLGVYKRYLKGDDMLSFIFQEKNSGSI